MVEETHDTGRAQVMLTITDRELFDRLGWFIRVRWAFGFFCLLALLVSRYVLGVRFHTAGGSSTITPAVNVVLVIFLYNAGFAFLVRIVRARGRITRKLTEFVALGQIICDLIAISVLIHYTGGVENSFVMLILVPIVIGAELLPRKLAYAAAGAATVFLNVLAWGEQQGFLPHVTVEPASGSGIQTANLHADVFYVLEATIALTVTIFATVFVVTTIAARLRSREAELEKAYHKLNLSDDAKSFFMRRAEHEIRAPMAAIHSILDAVALKPESLTQRQLSLIGRAKHRTKALMELVGDLRRYSRLRSPESIFQPEQLSFSDIVSDTVGLFGQQAEQRGVALESSVEPTRLRGSEQMLRELVTNLVANALQYTPSGGRIDVELTKDLQQATLTVSDTGIGIGEQSRERIFEEFYRAPEAKESFADGTGLGLAIVRRIVQIHHGRIDVSSRPEGGAVFSAVLPLSNRDKPKPP